MEKLRQRNEIDPAFRWNLSDIYPTREDWEKAVTEASALIEELPKLEGTLGTSVQSLRDGLDRVFAASEMAERIYLYASLAKAADNSDPESQAMEGRAINLYVAFSSAIAFFDPEILAMDEKVLRERIADPLLAGYRHIAEDTARGRAHTLSAEAEKLLAGLGDAEQTPQSVFEMFESVDMTFPKIHDEEGNEVELTHGNFSVYRQSRKAEVRREAFEVYFGEFRKFINTLAATYAGTVKMDAYLAKVRGYQSSCERALFTNNVPVSVYDALTEAIHSGLPVMKEYLELRKERLGLDELHMYDLYVPMVDSIDYPVSYDEAKKLVKAATAPLGDRYGKLLDEAYANRWIDVYESKGKSTGAFSTGAYGIHPFVMLNFEPTLDEAFTLAHELGHAMHSYFSSEANEFQNHEYRILVAEVASTVNEVLLTKYLLKTEKDIKRRAYILNHFLEDFRTTVFRQTLFAEFERKAHDLYEAGEPLTAEVLNRIYRELNVQYYDGAVVDELQDIEWARIPHFYTSFYVYQYATGFCSAVAIASHILETGDASGYLAFLHTGGSDYPLEELKIAGVDLTKPDTVANALKVFRDTVAEFREVLKEI